MHFVFVSLSEADCAPGMTKGLILGIGNPDRGDDGIGPLVARRLIGRVPAGIAVMERTGDALALIEDWAGRDMVVLVDAARRRLRLVVSIASICCRTRWRPKSCSPRRTGLALQRRSAWPALLGCCRRT